MSSREIAELTGKRHDHMMRDIRAMLVDLNSEGGVPSFGGTHTNDQNGQSYPIFRLPKRETLIIVSGYSAELRAQIIDRRRNLRPRPPRVQKTRKPAHRAKKQAGKMGAPQP